MVTTKIIHIIRFALINHFSIFSEVLMISVFDFECVSPLLILKFNMIELAQPNGAVDPGVGLWCW